ncbi:MAG: 50S ribosomal protein L10 [Patescibacteria group bacterium]|jgi:large subunit ribosomal protein L10|nr:50S ribosomal protein L10 [Patescibacteria group bacterium]
MAKSKAQKSLSKDKLVELFKKSSSAVFADYQGLTVAKADKLRKTTREQGVTYMVAKKSIINLAAKEAGLEIDVKSLPGMIGIAFGAEDEIAPAKILGDMTKETPIKLVGGIFDKKSIPQAQVVALSNLPGKQQLLGMLVSVIAGPMSGFVRALDAISKKETVNA